MSKNTFFTGQPVFSQLLNLIPRHIVELTSLKHASDRYCKRFMAYDHLVSMLYAGFFQSTSLRELITGLQANAGRLNHLGLKNTPRKSTLSDANKRRSADFFKDLYHELYAMYFSLPDSRSGKDEKLFIIDSTTISLFSSIMHGAGTSKSNGKKKGGAKAHLMVDAQHDIPAFISITEGKEHDLVFLQQLHVPDNATVVMDKAYVNYRQFKSWGKRNIKWVTRLKRDAFIQPVMDLPLEEGQTLKGVLRDRLVLLGRPSNKRLTPIIKARIIDYYDAEKQRTFSFITNDIFSDAFHIAELYRRRWQIEILFKRIKQRYPLKYFLGDNQNAIKIQIWAALLCDLLVKIIQKQVNKIKTRPWAYASISAMIKHHLMTYLNLHAFLINPEKTLQTYRPHSQQLKLFEGRAYF
jgi:hypothetical protein